MTRNKRFPRYEDDADYTTNAPSYYHDLGRKNKLLEKLAHKIWEYDDRLNERLDDLQQVLSSYLDQWDDRIENLDKEVSHIFVTWLNDGTLEQIINHDVLGNKADKSFVDAELEKVTSQLAQTTSNPLNHGAKGDGVTNDTQSFNEAFSTYKNTIITEKEEPYLLHKFQGVDNQRVVGVGKPVINLYYDELLSTSRVLVGLSSHSYYENLHFNSLEEQLEQNRTDLSSRENIHIKNSTFEGFRHGTDSSDANAWGIYFKDSKNITLENCEFENNTQSDIAITGGSENITIINAKGSKLHLNLEPNSWEEPIKNVRVIGGHYKRVSLLMPIVTKNSLQNIVFENCTIDELNYTGGDVEFSNCDIKSITRNSGFSGYIESYNSISKSQPLIKDTTFKTIGKEEDGSEWFPFYSTKINTLKIVKNENERFLQINTEHENVVSIVTSDKKSVSVDKTYMLNVTTKGNYLPEASFISQHVRINFFNSIGEKIDDHIVRVNLTEPNTKTDFKRHTAFLKPVPNTTHITIELGNSFNTSTNKVDFKEVALYEVLGDDVKEKEIPVTMPQKPTGVINSIYNIYHKGDIIYNENPVGGEYLGWVCTVSGNPGTWKGFGLIEV